MKKLNLTPIVLGPEELQKYAPNGAPLPIPRIGVDRIRSYDRGYVKEAARKHGTEWCHMFSWDWSPAGIEALHKFAESIGLRREWFQACPPHSSPHYDLIPSKRKLAVRKGAYELSDEELILWVKLGRRGLPPRGWKAMVENLP